jgi:hypothetical protein
MPAPFATHPATPVTPSGAVPPAASPAASASAAFEALLASAQSSAPSAPAAPVPAPAAYTPATAPAATVHEAHPHDPKAGASSAAGLGTTARDITDLIAAADLKARHESDQSKPLFNPDAPFSLPASDTFAGGSQDSPFTVPPPPAPAGSATKKTKTSKAFARPSLKLSRNAILAVAAIVILATAGFVAPRFLSRAGTGSPSTGTLVVQSNPAGVQVFVDGVDRGQTPARLSVPAGAHILELRGRGVPRVIPLNVSAGAEVSQYLEFANTPETGSLRVETQPAGAKVIVDGTDRGVAPVTIDDLLPGDHEVVLQTPLASARHVVSVQAGGTASIVTPVVSAATAAGPVSGWLTVKAPFSLEIREEGRLIGTTDADRVMLAAGRHDIELVNETLGYRVTRVVQVMPGKVASLAIDLPKGTVHLNASPWAEVWVDGQRVGETPIGNLSLPIGPHEVVFRHPQFGEKRHAISVTASAPTRVSVDMK